MHPLIVAYNEWYYPHYVHYLLEHDQLVIINQHSAGSFLPTWTLPWVECLT